MPRLTTRDYKRPSHSSAVLKLREFGLGVLVGVVLASAAFIVAGAHARHRAAASSHAHAGSGSRAAPPPAPAADDGASKGSDAAAAAAAAPLPQSAAAHPAAQAPQYDFYRMLPRLNVPVPRGAGHPSHAAPPAAGLPARGPTAAGPSYLLQVGSYRSSAEASAVRARLARAGISARIERVAEGSGTWNRVRIGPLSDPQLARVREQLRTHDIHALLIRADR